MKKSNFIIFLSICIMTITLTLFSCRNDKSNNKNTIIETERIPDSTKIAFKNIEFGINAKELLDLGIFDNSSKHEGDNSSIMMSKVDGTNFIFDKDAYKDVINPRQIISNDVISFYKLEQIGEYEYLIGVSLYKDKLFLFSIYLKPLNYEPTKDIIKNIVDLISTKYGHPQIENEIDPYSFKTIKFTEGKYGEEAPKPSIKYEWNTKYKTIRIYEVIEKIYSHIPVGRNGYIAPYWNKSYQAEFYNDSSFIPIMKNCQYIINKIIKKKEMQKVEESKVF